MSLLRLGVLAMCLSLTGCALPRDLVGVDNPTIPADSVADATRHKIFIQTTRADSEIEGALFSDMRSDEIGLASVDVSIPPTHVTGTLERPRTLPPDPRIEFAVLAPTVYADDAAFLASLNAALRARPRHQREILLFVHGYNSTTSDALLQVAQFVEDSAFEGVPVLFTWASAGRLSRYVYDINSALVARPKLLKAAQLVNQSNATDYYVFAHSMGSLLTMEAIVAASQAGTFAQTGRLRSVILAAPDIDLDLFRSQVSQLQTDFDNFFVLLSEDDAALRASRVIAGGVPRVGATDADSLAALGINAIDLSQIDDSTTGSHFKFSRSPEVVQLIGRGLKTTQQYGVHNDFVLDQILGDIPVRIVRSN